MFSVRYEMLLKKEFSIGHRMSLSQAMFSAGCRLRLKKQLSIDHRALCWLQTRAEERSDHQASSVIMSNYVLCGMQIKAEETVEH